MSIREELLVARDALIIGSGWGAGLRFTGWPMQALTHLSIAYRGNKAISPSDSSSLL